MLTMHQGPYQSPSYISNIPICNNSPHSAEKYIVLASSSLSSSSTSSRRRRLPSNKKNRTNPKPKCVHFAADDCLVEESQIPEYFWDWKFNKRLDKFHWKETATNNNKQQRGSSRQYRIKSRHKFNNAAKQIQRICRGALCRMEITELILSYYAMQIQRMARGFLWRRRNKKFQARLRKRQLKAKKEVLKKIKQQKAAKKLQQQQQQKQSKKNNKESSSKQPKKKTSLEEKYEKYYKDIKRIKSDVKERDTIKERNKKTALQEQNEAAVTIQRLIRGVLSRTNQSMRCHQEEVDDKKKKDNKEDVQIMVLKMKLEHIENNAKKQLQQIEKHRCEALKKYLKIFEDQCQKSLDRSKITSMYKEKSLELNSTIKDLETKNSKLHKAFLSFHEKHNLQQLKEQNHNLIAESIRLNKKRCEIEIQCNKVKKHNLQLQKILLIYKDSIHQLSNAVDRCDEKMENGSGGSGKHMLKRAEKTEHSSGTNAKKSANDNSKNSSKTKRRTISPKRK